MRDELRGLQADQALTGSCARSLLISLAHQKDLKTRSIAFYEQKHARDIPRESLEPCDVVL